ncbi:MAG: signal peptide peptidase SppA [Methanomicrobiales archaeon]|nr:signal peptide peptidase SppA [Methanomicrobiales archaeon]
MPAGFPETAVPPVAAEPTAAPAPQPAPPVLPVPPAPAPSLGVNTPPAQKSTGSGFKWLLLIFLGIIIITALCAALIVITDKDIRSVSVVRMEGTMITGDYADEEVIGSEVVGRELRQAADDPMVEAIVLRVNSPGGTPSAAQEIIGDLEYAKSKKPVVVSMGDIGTSAAYYVSAHADRIYANPDTFTAGVGVIWEFSDISQWMENEGYNISVVKSGSKKDMGRESRPLSADETTYAEKIVNDSFENFIADVTRERSIARADIEDGRVIRGADAIKMNVIDELGNLNDAIDGAKRMAESRR